jgi:hypothetical protein
VLSERTLSVDILLTHDSFFLDLVLIVDPIEESCVVESSKSHLVLHADTVQKTNIDSSILVNADPHYSKALPSKIDYERLSPYFAFRPHDVIQHTLRQTTQLAKSTVHYPMQRHLKSQFQMLRHKRLHEVIATDTYFSSIFYKVY